MKPSVASEDEQRVRCATDTKETGSGDHDHPQNSSKVFRKPRSVLRWFHLVQTKKSIIHNATENRKIFRFGCDKHEIEIESALLTISVVFPVLPLVLIVPDTRDSCALLLLTLVLAAAWLGQSEILSYNLFWLTEPDPENSSNEDTGHTHNYLCTCFYFSISIDRSPPVIMSLTV